MIGDLATQWRVRELAGDDRYRINGAMLTALEEDVGNLEQLEHGLRNALARGDFALVTATATDVLQSAGLEHLSKR